MSVRPGIGVAARGPHKLGVAIAAAALCLTFALAGAPAQAQAESQVCGGPHVSLPTLQPRVATASSLRHVGPLGWLGARAGTALAERSFLSGIEWIGSLAGHRSAGDRALQQLGEIRGHLDEVGSQLGRVEGHLDHIAAAVNDGAFEAAMAPLCESARQQRTLFAHFYVPLMNNGYRLAEVLDSNNPQRADDTSGGISLRQRVQTLLADFMRRSELRDDANDFGTLRHALLPDPRSQNRSILSRYGRVLMAKRILTRADSDAIRELYRELAQIRAIATWMSEEYWSGRPGREDLVRDRRQAMVHDNTAEERRLPPMIPAGVIIDLGSGPRGSLLGRPMWYAPVDRDLGWQPSLIGYDSARPTGFTIVSREVGEQVTQLNRPGSPLVGRAPALHDRWEAPTRVQLEALISNGCEADPTDPNRFRDAVRCANAVTPTTGGTVAGYLSRLNKNNDKWQRLFCTPRPGVTSCPEGAGPDAAKLRHVFIWTRNQHPEVVDCGSVYLGPGRARFVRQRWTTYTGFRTTTSAHVWHAIPQLNGRPHPAWRTDQRRSNERCGTWLASFFANAPSRNIPLKNVLLATRQVAASDLNPHDGIDYMGQSPAQR